jgi:Flp pilus assembly protein TadG
VLISALLVLLLFGVLQVAVYFYARTVVAAAASDAARYAANAGVGPDAGADRARRLITDGLNSGDAASVPCTSGASVDVATGLPTVTVHCTGRVGLLLLPLHMPLRVDVRASALKETAPEAGAANGSGL